MSDLSKFLNQFEKNNIRPLAHHLLDAELGRPLRNWLQGQVHDYLSAHKDATLAAAKTFIEGLIPKAVELLTPFLPIYLRPLAASIEPWVVGEVDTQIDGVYVKLVAMLNPAPVTK